MVFQILSHLELLAVDISSGFIWGELHDQVSRWIQRINEHGITKWVLYLPAIAKEDKIHVEQIQQELNIRDGKDVPLDTIRDILVKLARGDLIDYLDLIPRNKRRELRNPKLAIDLATGYI